MTAGKFEKVSKAQFLIDWEQTFYRSLEEHESKFPAENMNAVYRDIKIPVRGTAQSAGYDFAAPYSFEIEPGQSTTIALGIKAQIEPGWCLLLIPRSSLGFKHSAHLANTIGLIDSDYYNNSKNEGHIMAKIVNESNEKLYISKGVRLIQGFFVQFGTTVDDAATGSRTGGFGSTGET